MQDCKIIAVLGSGSCKPDDPRYKLAEQVGGLLAERGLGVENGGYGGVMEASARAARAKDGRVTAVFMGHKDPNEFCTGRINTAQLLVGMHGDFRNFACEWGLRMGRLLSSYGSIVIANDDFSLDGTLLEVLGFAHLARKGLNGKRKMAIIFGPGLRGIEWSGWVAKIINGYRRTEEGIIFAELPLVVTSSIVGAVDWVTSE